MDSKKIRRTVVASVATVAGVFGGLKLYAMKKKRQQIGMQQEVQAQESKEQNQEVS